MPLRRKNFKLGESAFRAPLLLFFTFILESLAGVLPRVRDPFSVTLKSSGSRTRDSRLGLPGIDSIVSFIFNWTSPTMAPAPVSCGYAHDTSRGGCEQLVPRLHVTRRLPDEHRTEKWGHRALNCETKSLCDPFS